MEGFVQGSTSHDQARIELCPRCRLWHDGKVITHCPDKERWTQAERDELRRRFRRDGIPLAPSTEQIQARFGARNRADAIAASSEEASDV